MGRGIRRAVSKPPVEEILNLLGRDNFGVFTTADALEAKITKGQLRRKVATGAIARLYPGVFALGALPRTWQQHVAAVQAWAGPKGVLSHGTAAALWDLSRFQSALPIHLSSTQLRHSCSKEVVLHRTSRWHPGDVCSKGPWRLTTVSRTVFDLAGSLEIDRLREVLDEVLIRDLSDVSRLKRRMEVCGVSGRKGAGQLRRLLEEFANEGLLPRSKLERLYADASARAGLPPPRSQHPVTIDGRTYRIDFAYPDQKIAVELDGWRFHGTRSAWESDIQRANALVSVGWQVIRGTWRDLQNRPESVVDRVAVLLRPSLPITR